MTRIGAHVHRGDPFAAATSWDAEVAQFFLGDPQAWKEPAFPGHPAALRDAFAEARIETFIHAPYRINVATTNNRIRIPSRKLLGQYLEAAPVIGAAAGTGRWPAAWTRWPGCGRPSPAGSTTTSASASIPATRGPAARSWPAWWTGSRPSPAGSTWCTAITPGTSRVPGGTGTPASRTGRSIRR